MIDKIADKVKSLRNQVNFYLHTSGEKTPDIEITDLPLKMTPFLESDDTWVNLPTLSLNKDCTSVLYVGSKGSKFSEHMHTKSSEQMIIVNEKGKMRVITPHEDTIVEYPNSILIAKNTPHIVYFLEETELVIIWLSLIHI